MTAFENCTEKRLRLSLLESLEMVENSVEDFAAEQKVLQSAWISEAILWPSTSH